MKAISLWQPWASLIAIGAKPFETRHWAPPRELIGQTIAIHAAKRVDKEAAAFATDLYYGQVGEGIGDALGELLDVTPAHLCARFGEAVFPVGCVVATARLDAAFQLGEPNPDAAVPAGRVVRRLVSRPVPECFSVRYDEFGDYAPGRWAWLLRDVKPLRPPAAAVGRQGFFDLPQGWLCA